MNDAFMKIGAMIAKGFTRGASDRPDESCDECRFFDNHVDEYPCSHCCHCYISKFQPKSGD